MPLAALNAMLAGEGQSLPVDPPLASHATLGGMVSVGISGPMQQKYGTVRDKVLGMKVMLADGTITRAGGKVVKNVAGYDVCKLYTGAMGTLVAILELTLRVSPAWQESCCFVLPTGGCEEARRIFLELRRMAVEPSGALLEEAHRERPQLVLRLQGGAAAVEAQTAKLLERFPSGEVAAADRLAAHISDFYTLTSPLRLRAECMLTT